MAGDIIPLSLIHQESKVFVNGGAEAVNLRVWAIAHGSEGEIGIGALVSEDDSPLLLESQLAQRIALAPVDALLVLQLTVEKERTLHVVPGHDGTIALRAEVVSG
jgi:hypothetical protein